ncbi:hypothetical protein OBBRIDRAFT_628509 [Obba rivulosa]|uniref:DUF6534 domain-containing protein n=1 Tax=Obba rivulosa TaxID=1052685 RepID=A0A8E2ASZ4_9APHY|nr:hypothetical protein OBBRIDRAFT_628509 [Obba rivulosa]
MSSPELLLSSAKPPALDNTLGATLIVVAAVLYGITNVQTYMYFRRYGDDPLINKLIIGFLWLLDTAHQVLVTHTVYVLTVTGFGNYLMLISPPWSDMGNIVITAVNDLTVRVLFCHRLWRLTGRNYFVTVPVLLGSVASFVGALAFCIEAIPLRFTTEFRSISWGLYIGFGAGAASDIVMASAMVFSLWKRRTGFHRTDSVVRVLMLYTVNSAVITSIYTRCESSPVLPEISSQFRYPILPTAPSWGAIHGTTNSASVSRFRCPRRSNQTGRITFQATFHRLCKYSDEC